MVATIRLDFGGDEFYGCCKKRGSTDSRPLSAFLSAALLEVLQKCVAAAHATMNEVAAAYDDCDLPTKNTELPIEHESDGVYCQLWLDGSKLTAGCPHHSLVVREGSCTVLPLD